MGDRNNPIKFGPEWLRNLAHERSAGASAAGNQSAEASGSSASSGATGPLGAAAASTSTAAANTANTANTQPKVQLAKLRYGKEEMLALFDRTSEAPTELKYIELLYHPRAKPPVALYNAFEVERRESSRPGTSVGGVPPAERFGIGRGIGRGVGANVEGRGRGRLQFFRQQSTGRGVAWHPGNTKLPGYSGGADEESTSAARSWNNNNVGNMAAAVRNPSDPSEWAQNKMYRSKRPGSTMNWRQSTRDDGEEWRSPEACSRSRSSLQDKWERDWGERPNQEKLQSWSSNRRTWVGGDSQNDDNLPEWAVDSAEAGAGSFDSSGAFHGYSNDDTNLPKTQETSYPLTRSHTHGSFVRSKTAEEGSDEWWASDKAKKLSPKRFDASDIKFKTPTNVHDGNSNSSANLKLPGNREEDLHTFENPETAGAAGGAAAALPEPPETSTLEEAFNKKHVRFAESKTFDALMRSDINMEEANDERGNFQSVMITPNNSLRQKHQNMMSSIDNTSTMPRRASGIVHILNNMMPTGRDHSNQQQTPESSLIDKTMDLALEDKAIQTNLANASGGSGSMINPSSLGMPSVMSNAVNSMAQIPTPSMQLTMSNPILQNQGLTATSKNNMPTVGIQGPGIQTGGLQNVGVTNSALNASLGLPLGPSSNPLGPPLGMPLQGIPPPMLPLPNHGMNNPGMGGAGMQTGPGFPSSGGMPGFPPSGGMPGMSSSNVANNSLFIGQHPNNSGDIPMPNHGNQPNMYPMHGLQHSGPPGGFSSSVYGNIRQQSATPAPNVQSVADLWYYEDPKKDIQGPFSSKEMYSWYRAGFFSASLMVRRACDAIMRPLGSYGPVVPFAQLEMMYPMSSGFESRNQGTHDSMLNPQQGLGLDPMNMSNLTDANAMDSSMPYGLMRNPPYGQQQPMDTLWSRPSPPDLMWMHDAISAQRNDPRVNNFPMYFWDRQFGELYMLQLIRPEGDATEPSDIGPNPLLPEDLKKEMKTEDQILAQLRASQTIGSPQNMHFLNEPPPLIMPPSNKPTESYPTNMSLAQDLKELQNLQHLQKMIQEDSLNDIPLPEMLLDNQELKQIPLPPTIIKKEEIAPELIISKPHSQTSNKATAETKAVKQTKIDAEKSAKNKDNNNTKTKTKKAKEEKKEELTETTARVEDASKPEKRSEEPSPSKGKKDDKLNKKDLEKEKKEWIKEGFTVVKGAEKIGTKEKKKQEELKAFEEAERKRQEEEKLAIEEDRKKKLAEVLKKQQEIHHQQQQQRQAYDLIGKRAPWSAVSNHAMQATNKDGLTLAEIQRLEREKKLEQMREQQHMMQLIAQQQAAAMAREQEVQAGLGWAKKKTATNAPEQSMTEIQAEARKQAATAAAATAAMHAFEEIQAPPPPVNLVPWGTPSNGGGFWDTPAVQQPKPQPSPKAPEPVKPKKKLALNMPAKKDPVPAAEFEAWCTTVLTSWSAKIDVPTFVGFLKDIESPYEVKDYVKCYLGETKDSNDFARQFLERRSKLLRVGMVTPSDDLCSPAIAINPRNSSGSDYQEGKGKKNKKNKMLKVDARILGFSVTAAEDRINVGDIDQTGV